jgi:hypothetical protein
MLESGDLLRTWGLAQLPHGWQGAHARTKQRASKCAVLAFGDEVAAEQLGDHRIAYLDYEGEVSGGRGSVIRVAAGTYKLVRDETANISVRFESDTVQGMATLAHQSASHWRLFCEDAGSRAS